MPSKRGFTNIFRIEYMPINLSQLNIFESGTEVTPDLLRSRRIVRDLRKPIKVLGEGAIDRALTIKADKFSKSAIAKIEAAGGSAETLG